MFATGTEHSSPGIDDDRPTGEDRKVEQHATVDEYIHFFRLVGLRVFQLPEAPALHSGDYRGGQAGIGSCPSIHSGYFSIEPDVHIREDLSLDSLESGFYRVLRQRGFESRFAKYERAHVERDVLRVEVQRKAHDE